MYILVFISNVVLLCAAANDSDIGTATVPFPNEVTTEMSQGSSARPMVTDIVSSGEPSVVITTITQAATTMSVPVTTTPVVIATDSIVTQSMTSMPTTEKTSVLPTSCPSGFVQCTDGKWEPFEALCGEGGIVTVSFPTEVTTEMSLGSSTRPIVTDIAPQKTSTSSPSLLATGVTNLSGKCQSGFVMCVDGTCEPFEALCGEGGVVTVTYPTDIATTGTIPALSGSPTPVISTSESIAPSTTVPPSTTIFAVPTDSSGKEVCADGWEQCKDGTCEPFHWLCTEHDGSSPIIG